MPGVTNADGRKCTVYRTYKACLTELSTLPECKSSLTYRTSLIAVNAQIKEFKCDAEGPIYPERDGGEVPEEETVTPCKFKGPQIYNFCSLFGDPHLVTFSGDQLTCKLEGAWPLIDNQFLTVQVTNALLDASTKSATVTKKVSNCLIFMIRISI